MVGFLFGGNTGIRSPEELARRRAMARQVMARSAGETPQNVWQGLNSIAEAIGQRVERNRLDEAEAAGQKSAESAYAPIAQALAIKQTPDAVAVTNALSNPWLNDGQRDVLRTYFNQQVGGDDPRFRRNPTEGTDDNGETAVSQWPQSGGAPVPVQFPLGFNDGDYFDSEADIPEGGIVVDDEGSSFKKVNGKLVQVQ